MGVHPPGFVFLRANPVGGMTVLAMFPFLGGATRFEEDPESGPGRKAHPV